MKSYINSESGVVEYEYGSDWIHVRFKYGGLYEYKSPSIEINHIDTMKQLADSQDGLGNYINTNREEVYSKGVKIS